MLRRHVGRRGVVLLILASVWVLFGLSILSYVPPPGESGRFRLEAVDSPAWAWAWVICGVVAAVYAVGRHWGWNDTPGWVAGIIPPMLWTALYTISYLWWVATGGALGAERGWVGVVSWILVVGLLQVIAGWEDGLAVSRANREPVA